MNTKLIMIALMLCFALVNITSVQGAPDDISISYTGTTTTGGTVTFDVPYTISETFIVTEIGDTLANLNIEISRDGGTYQYTDLLEGTITGVPGPGVPVPVPVPVYFTIDDSLGTPYLQYVNGKFVIATEASSITVTVTFPSRLLLEEVEVEVTVTGRFTGDAGALFNFKNKNGEDAVYVPNDNRGVTFVSLEIQNLFDNLLTIINDNDDNDAALEIAEMINGRIDFLLNTIHTLKDSLKQHAENIHANYQENGETVSSYTGNLLKEFTGTIVALGKSAGVLSEEDTDLIVDTSEQIAENRNNLRQA